MVKNNDDDSETAQAIRELTAQLKKDVDRLIDRYTLFWGTVIVIFAILDIALWVFRH